MQRHFYPWISTILCVFLLGLLSPVAAKPPRPSGTVSLATTSVAVGIGVNWGDGVLTVNGKRYTFEIKGLEIGAVGAAQVRATGKVFYLNKVSNFTGTYIAVTGDAALGAGAGVLTMRNEHGVVVNLSSVQQGVKLTAGAEGILIRLKL